jgi:DinB family protein
MEFDTLYLELVDSTNMIMALLAGISEHDAKVKPDADAWSILETLCHLYDEEREDFREHLDFILHRQEQEWHQINPPAWVLERKYNTREFREMKEKFFGERSRSLDWLRGLGGADWDTHYTSPFGSLTAGEMFASWVAHDNLHIRQLVELRRARLERISQPYSVAYAGDW